MMDGRQGQWIWNRKQVTVSREQAQVVEEKLMRLLKATMTGDVNPRWVVRKLGPVGRARVWMSGQ